MLLAIAILGGQLVLWRVFGTTGLFHGGEEIGFWSFSRVWYALVALPARAVRDVPLDVALADLGLHARADLAAAAVRARDSCRPRRRPRGPGATGDGVQRVRARKQRHPGAARGRRRSSKIASTIEGTGADAGHVPVDRARHRCRTAARCSARPLFRARRPRSRSTATSCATTRCASTRSGSPHRRLERTTRSAHRISSRSTTLAMRFRWSSKTRPVVFGPRTVFTVWFAGLVADAAAAGDHLDRRSGVQADRQHGAGRVSGLTAAAHQVRCDSSQQH